VRLFIAVNFSESTHKALITLRDGLRKKSQKGRFTLDDNIHLTLVFLGECDVKQTNAAITAMNDIVFAPFLIEINRIGCFQRNGGGLWWAGVKESKPLLHMQQKLEDKLRIAGFSIEKRRFSPHITLGRQIVTDEKDCILTPFGESVTKINLMESKRVGGKLTYESIYEREAKTNEIL
jgi:2'-5' RNA ligase